MMRTRFRLAIGAALLAFAAAAPAHVTVWPKQSQPGAHERYAVRVPNEKQADTLAVELRFPAGLRVTAFEQKPGWLTEAMRDSKGTIVGVRWTGRLPPEQFTEFGLLAVNPASAKDLVWAATQRFADGTSVEWSGAEGSKSPAPHVQLLPAAPGHGSPPAHADR